MTSTQRLPASLTPLDVALASLLRDLKPVTPVELSLAEALQCVAAEMPPLEALPAHDAAMLDGWALRAADLVGASSYTPLPLSTSAVWVEAGDSMPEGRDCILDDDSVDRSGPMAQALAEAIPGQGVRRAGNDIAAGARAAETGQCVLQQHVLLARAAGMQKMAVRRPRLHVLNVSGGTMTAELIAENARAEGAEVVTEVIARETGAIAKALEESASDLLIIIGGTGVGRTDTTVAALRQRGEVAAHGLALQPGRTAAVGKTGTTPVIAMPGAPGQALAVWWTLALPVLERLTARRERRTVRLKLARKIASSIGLAELVLLGRNGELWMPLAAGDLPLEMIARADAWLLVPGGSEGFAAGTTVDAYMLRE